MTHDDKEWVVTQLDPDYKDHFTDFTQAYEYYWRYANEDVRLQLRELNEQQNQWWSQMDTDEQYINQH